MNITGAEIRGSATAGAKSGTKIMAWVAGICGLEIKESRLHWRCLIATYSLPTGNVGASQQRSFGSPFALMESAISFGEANSGLQAATINGPVSAEFHHHHPPGTLQRV
jgi:hypothetical protein